MDNTKHFTVDANAAPFGDEAAQMLGYTFAAVTLAVIDGTITDSEGCSILKQALNRALNE